MKGLHKFINWYTQRFPFPGKGWKYFKWWLKKLDLLEKNYVKKMIRGLLVNVTPSDHIQQQLFWYGHYEKPALLTWHALVANHSVVLDIGANIGLYSLLAADKAINGKIYAFEAAASLREQLEHNVLLNNFKNIVTLPFAAGNVNEPTPFYISNGYNLGMSGFSKAENFSGVVEYVNTIRLDDWAIQENLSRLDVVKIDVEGAEMLVLSGMSDLLARYRPAIFIEILNETLQRFDQQASDIYIMLQRLDYVPYEVTGTNRLRLIRSHSEGETIIFLPADHRLPQNMTVS